MANKDQLIAQVSQELLDELTDNGRRDLSLVRLSQMEAEVYQLADRISERLLRGMLEDQAELASVEACPCCGSPLEDRPPDNHPIKLQRCDLQWEQPVKRCRRCRRDFFPSGDHDGMCGRSDM